MSIISTTSRQSRVKKLLDKCDLCFRAKQTRNIFPISNNTSSELFHLVHCDLWGSYTKSIFTGTHYFLTLVDDCSHSVWVYLLKTKTEVKSYYLHLFALVKTQFKKVVQIVRSDNGIEFQPLMNFFFFLIMAFFQVFLCRYSTTERSG